MQMHAHVRMCACMSMEEQNTLAGWQSEPVGQGWPFPGSPGSSHGGVLGGALDPHDHHARLLTFLSGAPDVCHVSEFLQISENLLKDETPPAPQRPTEAKQ